MERSGGFGQSLAHSFSLPSLVEGSEPISEAEEFVEVWLVASLSVCLHSCLLCLLFSLCLPASIFCLSASVCPSVCLPVICLHLLFFCHYVFLSHFVYLLSVCDRLHVYLPVSVKILVSFKNIQNLSYRYSC